MNDDLRERLFTILATGDEGDILDADDLLVTDLRCPTCGGRGDVFRFHDLPDPWDTCPTCDGTGRRDVQVVDAEAWDLLIGLLRAQVARRNAWMSDDPYELTAATARLNDALDACLANDVLRAEVER